MELTRQENVSLKGRINKTKISFFHKLKGKLAGNTQSVDGHPAND